MYAPYPTSGPAQEPERIQPPRSVLNAVKLMCAGAALEVLALIIALVTTGNLKSAILARHPAYMAASLHTAEVARTVPLVIGGPDLLCHQGGGPGPLARDGVSSLANG